MAGTGSRIVVKLSPDLASSVPYQDDVVSAFPLALQASWNLALPGLSLDRALPGIDSDEVRRRLDLNAQASGTPSEELLSFFVISLPAGVDAEALAAAARSLPLVEHAYVEQAVQLAGVNVAEAGRLWSRPRIRGSTIGTSAPRTGRRVTGIASTASPGGRGS